LLEVAGELDRIRAMLGPGSEHGSLGEAQTLVRAALWVASAPEAIDSEALASPVWSENREAISQLIAAGTLLAKATSGLCESLGVPARFREALSRVKNRLELGRVAERVAQKIESIRSDCSALFAFLKLDVKKAFDASDIDQIDVVALTNRFRQWCSVPSRSV